MTCKHKADTDGAADQATYAQDYVISTHLVADHPTYDSTKDWLPLDHISVRDLAPNNKGRPVLDNLQRGAGRRLARRLNGLDEEEPSLATHMGAP